MANSWFRLYAEIANDPKVLIVTEALRWRYVALLCLQCNAQYENRPDDEVALALRITVDEWVETKQTFIKRGLINRDGKISAWEKRQYISDIVDPTAADRQKRYRDKRRNERNATVTSRLPEQIQIQNRSNKERNADDKFVTFWSAYPNKSNKANALKSWVKIDPSLHDQIIASVKSNAEHNEQWIKDGGKFIPHAATWLNGKRWEDEIVDPDAAAFDELTAGMDRSDW